VLVDHGYQAVESRHHTAFGRPQKQSMPGSGARINIRALGITLHSRIPGATGRNHRRHCCKWSDGSDPRTLGLGTWLQAPSAPASSPEGLSWMFGMQAHVATPKFSTDHRGPLIIAAEMFGSRWALESGMQGPRLRQRCRLTGRELWSASTCRAW
jgi:hypothetical protein